ncbi:MAG: serpin family protein [Clostridia bacterium]|nr:serpin family protein [Clostridia bacterium]
MKKFLVLTLLISIAVTLFSCNTPSEVSNTDVSNNAIGIDNITIEQQTLLKNLASEWNSSSVTKDSDFRLRQYDFATKLYKAFSITSENENMMFSPLSIQLAFAMQTNGAKGETKTELENFLGGVPMEQLNTELKNFVSSLSSANDYKIGIANSIWMRNNALELKESFKKVNTDYYDAELYSEPFDNKTAEKINNWVSENTDEMIEKIVEIIDPSNVMYLVNAIVFDAKWANPVDDYSIKEDEFTTISGEKKKVEMMRSEEQNFIITDDATGFVKPYKNNKYSFVALLPNEDVEIKDYINSLNAQKLCSIMDNIQSGLVKMYFPKFEYEYTIELRSILEALGVKRAFNPSEADLTDMATSEIGNIYIGSALHKTYISVDNEGTRAAAVTAIVESVDSEIMPIYQLTITLDRPFVYMIIENETKLPIFIGTVMDIGE